MYPTTKLAVYLPIGVKENKKSKESSLQTCVADCTIRDMLIYNGCATCDGAK